MANFRTSALALLVLSCTTSPKEDDRLLTTLMKQNPGQFDHILQHPEKFEVQIIYTQINRDADNLPQFKSFYYNIDTNRYFYPASTVKLPVVLLALEKLNRLNIAGLNKHTIMFSDSVYSGQLSVAKDTTSEDGLPSVSHYSKKILVVSDNDAFNRLYEFMGQKEINDRLNNKGYHVRILHRLERFLNPDQNRHTESIRFMHKDSLIYHQPMLVNEDSIQPPGIVLKGKGYQQGDSLINKPFDFTYKNFFSLSDQQDVLKTIMFPESVPTVKRFDIRDEDRMFVLQYMSQLPRETVFPPYYTDTTYYDAYCKFLLYGNDHSFITDNIRIFNKVGNAYGYLIDNAYIVDFENNVEFMLSAVINCNTDGIYNDGVYAYEEIGYPFMKNIGQVVYRYERQRKRMNIPDLAQFKLTYDR